MRTPRLPLRLFICCQLLVCTGFGWQWTGVKPVFEGGEGVGDASSELVAIVSLKSFSGQLQFVCTGVWLDAEWILTVAHGVAPLAVGELGVVGSAEGGAAVDSLRLIESVVLPVGFDEASPQNDLALLKVVRRRSEKAINREKITIRKGLPENLALEGWGGGGPNEEVRLARMRWGGGEVAGEGTSEGAHWVIRPDQEAWHIGPGNSGAPVFAADLVTGGRSLVGLLISARTEQRTLKQTALRVLPLAPWAETIGCIRAGGIPEGFEKRSFAMRRVPDTSECNSTGRDTVVFEPLVWPGSADGISGGLPSPAPEGPHTVYPLMGTTTFQCQLGPEHRLPARVPLYVRHFLHYGEEGEHWTLRVESPLQPDEAIEVSLWATDGMRLLGRRTSGTAEPLIFHSGRHPVLMRIELIPNRPLKGVRKVRSSLSRTESKRR